MQPVESARAQSGVVWYHGQHVLSCEPCARRMRLKWQWHFLQGECAGCGCTLDPLFDTGGGA